jgi:deoxyribodipyrimidine photo-lyase
MLSEERIKTLNSSTIKDRSFVLYWMQSSQRVEANLALEYAIYTANHLKKPLIVFFGLDSNFPEANLRHFSFLLEGLQEVNTELQKMNVKLIVWEKSPPVAITELARDSCVTIVDKGYLKTLKKWYIYIKENLSSPLIQVEDNVFVPVDEVSTKEEYSAATLRPKLERKFQHFLTLPATSKPKQSSLDLEFDTLDMRDIQTIMSNLKVDKSVGPSEYFSGGTSEARRHLELFVKEKLPSYPELKNDPTVDGLSDLSPYLHFGQISPIQIAQQIISAGATDASKETFLEELIVRRELAINYVHYNPNYDSFDGLPNWAKATLLVHQIDSRDYLYTLEELENAQTHDNYWNAAQNQMRLTGKMHGYMRMYWGKKIIQWTKNPQEAFKIALYLNDKYELDGRDPNGYAGIAWCFGKHDRPWKTRAIFGSIRYMNDKGLERKFDADAYVEKVKNL